MKAFGLTDERIGIFESMRTYRGKIFRQDEHIRRFMESLKTAGLKPISGKVIKQEIKKALSIHYKETKAKEDVFIRVTYWPGETLKVMVTKRVHPSLIYTKGVCLQTSPVKRTLNQAMPSQVKTTAYQNAVMATLEVKASETYEWVFLDRNGLITEVRIGNLFIVKDGRLWTPPTPGILDGVTRRFVIECALQIGIPVKENPLTRHEVYNADEAFLSNTSWEILPVSTLDQRKIGKQIPGPITCRLQQQFQKQVKKECP